MYSKSPCPFQGQKNLFLKDIERVVRAYAGDNTLGEGLTFVDCFGGSGLVSRRIKDALPSARVVYNDFDNFRSRLSRIPRTNEILREIRLILKGAPRETGITTEQTRDIRELLDFEAMLEDLDFETLASSLLFAGKRAGSLEFLLKQKIYNRVVLNDIPEAVDYLEGLEVVSCDYKLLMSSAPEAVFVLDPPYMNTNVDAYVMESWGLSAHLNVLKAMKGREFMYFTSSKSEVLELLSWLSENTDFDFDFDFEKISMKKTKGVGLHYEDSLIHNLKPAY